MIPLLIVVYAGVYGKAKLELANTLLIDWQIDLRMEENATLIFDVELIDVDQ